MFLVLLLLNACMGPEEAKVEADEATYGAVARGRSQAGQTQEPDFNIEPSPNLLRRELLLPRSDDTKPGPRERLALKGRKVNIDLKTALSIAARNSRGFQDEKERLYSTALGLTSTIHEFEANWFSTVDLSGNAVGDGESDTTPSISENGSLGFTRFFESGGSMTFSIGDALSRVLSNVASSTASGMVNLAISLPLLRGAGRDIAFESVVQAERDVVYAVRRFERFKRTFAVSVMSEYLNLLEGLQTISNNENDYRRRQETAVENRQLGDAGRIARTDVERTNQAELSSENSLINSRESHQNALDRFKQTLGLPTDCVIEVDSNDLEVLSARGLENLQLDEDEVMVVALTNRLDLATSESSVADAARKVYVAADALRAGVEFSGSVGFDTPNLAENSFRLDPLGNADYSLGLLLDLPLEQTSERNAYRSALINLESSRRSAESSEDSTKLEVRSALRGLRRARESHRIQKAALAVAETNVDAARLLKDAGEGSTNDLLDAQNNLIEAQNSVTGSLIGYFVAKLELYRDMGVLVVTPDGIDEEATRKLINEK